MPRRGRRRGALGLPVAGRTRRLVVALSAATMLLWVGGSAILPQLPNFLRRHGASTTLVGIVMAAYFAASVLTQYPAGRLSDRFGRRPVILLGLVVFAAGSVGFGVTSGPWPAIAFRALQGIGAGAVTVASAAMIGTELPLEERGAAFGALYGSQMLALAVGPLLGTLTPQSDMGLLFVAAAVAAGLAALPVLSALGAEEPAAAPGLEEVSGHPRAPGEEAPAAPVAATVRSHRTEELEALAACAPAAVGRGLLRSRLTLTPALAGVLLVFGATGLLGGVYETCWTLLLHLRGATSFQIGLSWTLFALPFAALSVPAGRLAERADRRMLVLGALGLSAAFCVVYPFLHSVALLLGLGVVEAAGSVIGSPAAVLVLTEHVAADAQGEAQGAVETGRTAATALAAAASGALFGVAPALPFVVAAGLVVACSGAVAVAWRSLPGRIAGPATADTLAGTALLAVPQAPPSPEK